MYEAEWADFYESIQPFHTSYLISIYYDGNQQKYTDIFTAQKMWHTQEYDAEYGEYVDVGHIIFENTKVDGNTLKTTQIEWKHIIWSETLLIVSRTVAENAVTTTTDYPVPHWPE